MVRWAGSGDIWGRKPQGLFSLHHWFSLGPWQLRRQLLPPVAFWKRGSSCATGPPRNSRIEIITISFTDQLLNDDRHFLFFRALSNPSGKRFRALKISGGIHQLDGVYQLCQPRIEIRMIVGNHVGLIKTGIGAKLSIFQEAGRPNGQR